jgi:hypothetical protein
MVFLVFYEFDIVCSIRSTNKATDLFTLYLLFSEKHVEEVFYGVLVNQANNFLFSFFFFFLSLLILLSFNKLKNSNNFGLVVVDDVHSKKTVDDVHYSSDYQSFLAED